MSMNIESSKTFATPAEAAAFMLGFRTARSGGTFAVLDDMEPQTVLVDHTSEHAEAQFIEHLEQHQKESRL